MLSPQQSAAIEALVNGATRAEAARVAEIGERTIYTWIQNEEFISEWEVRQAAHNRMVAPQFHAIVPLAQQRLLQILADDDSPRSLWIQAAQTVFSRMPPMTTTTAPVALDVTDEKTETT